MARFHWLLRLIVAALVGMFFQHVSAAGNTAAAAGTFTFGAGGNGMQLGGPGLAPQILVSPEDWPGVLRVASDLATDFGRVIGTNGTVTVANWARATALTAKKVPTIVLGTVGHSTLIDGLVNTGHLSTASVTGQWETYTHTVVAHPTLGNLFVITGSDLRGSVFGAYDVSEAIGVSPWYYWADVPATTHSYIFAKPDTHMTAGPPSVKFRGLFLNDEAPALTNWANANFHPGPYGSPFKSDFYKRIFELVLRLRGNYVWPAMWGSMFYLDDASNGPTANEMGVYMGTSHHEPLARAGNEQSRFMSGRWDWNGNKANVQQFMKNGIIRASNWSTVWTVGMRGDGDVASPTLDSATLQQVIQWQSTTLTQVLGKPASNIPQAWMLYKEVPGYWQNGMKIPDEVTLVWSDDNRGNIRRLPTASETPRQGGSGVYYHFDYVGAPRDYKWINTIQLQKTWEQMSMAYKRKADRLWIVNVGDLKGLELPTAHWFAMAWDMSNFQTPSDTRRWFNVWAAQQWGTAVSQEAVNIMSIYGTLLARNKYETLSITPFFLSTSAYDEAELNLGEWTSLLSRARAAYSLLPDSTRASFFEVVLHPVMAGRAVYQIYTQTAIALKYANEHRISTNDVAQQVRNAFADDQNFTSNYHKLLNGKWNHMMDQVHIGYTSWNDPTVNTLPQLPSIASSTASQTTIMGVSVFGSTAYFPNTVSLKLPLVRPYLATNERSWVEVYARNNGAFRYTISANASFVTVTNPSGSIKAPGIATSDVRAYIKVDFKAAPAGKSTVALTVTNVDSNTKATVIVPIDATNVPSSFVRGHVESNGGVVSIELLHYSASSGSWTSSPSGYEFISDYGRTLGGIRIPPTSGGRSAPAGPALVYPFYTFSGTSAASLTAYLGLTLNPDPALPAKYAFAIDNAVPTVVQPVAAFSANDLPFDWNSAATANTWVKTTAVGGLAPGAHTLRVWVLTPTVVLTKVVIDVGGLQSSALGPPESQFLGA